MGTNYPPIIMKKLFFATACIMGLLVPKTQQAQIDQQELGAWYMYFFNTTFNEGPWGIQGDIQFRNWDMGSDLEQLLLRTGLTYKPKSAEVLFTLGYGHITSGAYGDSKAQKMESRVYQEALFPVKFGGRIYTKHRFRYEQRFVDGQDFRTRYRYNLFVTVPLNNKAVEKNTLYVSLYNELFVNGQRNIGDQVSVEYFDRNRLYSALGYAFSKTLKVQLGVMRQGTGSWAKNQLQLSVHQKW